MYENGWNRFARTGQISDYLTYKGYPATKNKTGNAGECRNAEKYRYRQSGTRERGGPYRPL